MRGESLSVMLRTMGISLRNAGGPWRTAMPRSSRKARIWLITLVRWQTSRSRTHMHMDHVGGLLADGVKARLRPDLRVHLAAAEAEFWAAPDFSRVSMPPGFPDALRSTAKRFLNAYHGQLRPFEAEYEVAPGWSSVAPAATPPGTAWSVWRPAATG